MDNQKEVRQVIYTIIQTQIQFGLYSYGDRLPTIENSAQLYLVSNDTIRHTYLRLKNEGYLTVSKRTGVRICVQYTSQEKEQFIQTFFSTHRNAMLDLSRSMKPLFSHAQWLAFKNASPDLLDKMEQLIRPEGTSPLDSMIQHLQLIYGSLNNLLLMRLVWQAFMFYQAPFLCVPGNVRSLNPEGNPLISMIALSRSQDWNALHKAIENFQELFSASLQRFFEDRISAPAPSQQTEFAWSAYKKASQLCYSLAMNLLIGINRGKYPTGAALPSIEKLAEINAVSVSTIRRTLTIMNSIGAVKTENGVGTKVLSLESMSENCDFSNPSVVKRLRDYLQSLHILVLSCREVSQLTISSASPSCLVPFRDRLHLLHRLCRCELSGFGLLELICHCAPLQSIRIVYSELFQQLLWGNPLRAAVKYGALESYYEQRLCTFLDCLEHSDACRFAVNMEEYMIFEYEAASKIMRTQYHITL